MPLFNYDEATRQVLQGRTGCVEPAPPDSLREPARLIVVRHPCSQPITPYCEHSNF